jgi:hypothetical protein
MARPSEEHRVGQPYEVDPCRPSSLVPNRDEGADVIVLTEPPHKVLSLGVWGKACWQVMQRASCPVVFVVQRGRYPTKRRNVER